MASNGSKDPEKGTNDVALLSPPKEEQPKKGPRRSDKFKIDLEDALTPDPGTEAMFKREHNKFAYTPGQLSKLLNPKSLNAFYALGGLAGLEKGLHTNRVTGLSVDETSVDGAVTFEEVAPTGTPKFGKAGDTVPEGKGGNTAPVLSEHAKAGNFLDRKNIFGENRLPEKDTKSLLELAWQTYNDKSGPNELLSLLICITNT